MELSFDIVGDSRSVNFRDDVKDGGLIATHLDQEWII
jgi:hypothetical protein